MRRTGAARWLVARTRSSPCPTSQLVLGVGRRAAVSACLQSGRAPSSPGLLLPRSFSLLLFRGVGVRWVSTDIGLRRSTFLVAFFRLAVAAVLRPSSSLGSPGHVGHCRGRGRRV